MVKEWKNKKVEDIKKELKKYPLVGLVKLKGIPSKQIQKVRRKLIGKGEIIVTKRSLMLHAFKNTGFDDLAEFLDGSASIILSNENAFKLNKFLEDSKSSALIKAGQIAPEDIIVPEGNTGLPAGPLIGDIQGAGLPAGIDKGKIVIKKETVIVKKGGKVSPIVATALAKLKIEPINIGLDIIAVKENGIIYKADVLHLDIDKALSEMAVAHQNAINLSVNAGIPMKENIVLLIQSAVEKCKNLAFSAKIVMAETVEYLIGKANQEAVSLENAKK